MKDMPALPALDRELVNRLHGRSLLQTSDWSTAEIDALLAVASRFEAADRAGRSPALLPDELAYAMFFDNSTRTKSAWAGAASRLGAPPFGFDFTPCPAWWAANSFGPDFFPFPGRASTSRGLSPSGSGAPIDFRTCS